MNVLTLIIKREYFDEILSGEKKTETREIRPKTASRYINYRDLTTGEVYAAKDLKKIPEDHEVEVQAIEYDAIQLYVGYATNRPAALVEAKGAEIIEMVDENGESIVYEENGEEYLTCVIEYALGKVLNKTNC